jgi:hypothetical protein
MKTYNTFRASESANLIIEELNAAVLTSTFKSKRGLQVAELYTRRGLFMDSVLIAENTCPPSNYDFNEKVIINL